MSEREEILKMLEPLFEKAEKEGLWFESNYQRFNLTPSELRERHAKGELIWGPVNWTLIDPKTLLDDPEQARLKAIKHNERLYKRGLKE
jgi:hypothetical protein